MKTLHYGVHMLCVTEAVNDLVICRLSCQAGHARGGDEVFMLTEKVNKGKLQHSSNFEC